MATRIPVVALVGRPNVGKSSLFNRLVGKRVAIISETPGTTRDRLVARVSWEERPFLLVDTGGLVTDSREALWTQIRRQVEAALAQSDLILFVTDAVVGFHPADDEIAALLRRTGKPVILVVNKAEGNRQVSIESEFYRLGFGEPYPASAVQNSGLEEVMDRVLQLLPSPPISEEAKEPEVLRLGILGRPNVGKSSLLNAMVGEERAIVHEEPGTTRDAVDTFATYQDHPLLLIDTAGLRRRGHIAPGIEYYSTLRTLGAIERCNVAALVLDTAEMVTAQDTHIAGYVLEAFRGLVITVNKWDLAQGLGLDRKSAERLVRARMPWANYAPIVFTSALTGQGVPQLMASAFEVFQQRSRWIAQEELDQLLATALEKHHPPSHPQRTLRIYRLTQASNHPPTFIFWVNRAAWAHFSYRRFLENCLRSTFGFTGNHLRLVFKERERARKR
ncbi:MAG: ribosome biogenesis GTPase Der [Chloroflexi bacterium]|nr:ribosome biogenesis GTPase Der [Chloroflexota bacterium]